MGSPETEAERDDNEVQHQVTISRPFYIGIHQVTQAQYEAVMGENPSYFIGEADSCHHPVESVSWNDGMEFCRELSRMSGRNIRLPTEAEWEYACRAGAATPFNTGSNISAEQANYRCGVDEGVHRVETTPVGNFPANEWGLYDMHGNVCEWCSDWYGDYPKVVVTDPKGPSNGSDRIVRGGGWLDIAETCRSAYRGWNNPDDRLLNTGFRVALG